MSTRRRRTLMIVLPLGALLALYAGLHTSWAQQRVLGAVLARMPADGSVRVERLEYTLHRLQARLYGVALADGAAEPYFEAAEISVDLPWSVLTSGLSFQAVELVDPRVNVIVDESGRSNLGATTSTYPDRIPIDRLDVERLGVQWTDQRGEGVSFRARGLSLALVGATAGDIQAPEPAALTFGATSLDIEVRDGALGWNGSDLEIAGAAVSAGPVDLRVDGNIDNALGDAQLTFGGTVATDLAGLGALVDPPLDIEGTASLDGRITGSPAELVAGADLRSDRLRWQTYVLDDVAARLEFAAGVLRVSDARAGLAGGSVRASAAVAVAADTPSTLTLEWQDLPSALIPYEPEPTWPAVDLLSAGSMVLAWPGTMPTTEALSATAEARIAPGGGSAPAMRGTGHVRLVVEPGSDTRLVADWADFAVRDMLSGYSALEPSQVDGQIAGRAELWWAGAVPAPDAVTGQVEVALVAARFEDVFGSATLEASLSRGAWQAEARLRSDGLTDTVATLRGSLDDAPISGTAEGSLQLTPEFTSRWAPTAPPLDGTLHARVAFEGTVDNPRARGTVEADNLSIGEVMLTRASTRFDVSPAILGLEGLVVRGSGIDVDGDLAWDRAAATIAGRLAGRIDDLGQTARWLPTDLATVPEDLAGSAVVDLTFDGPLPTGNVAGTIAADDIAAFGLTGGRLRGRLSHSPYGVRVDELVLEQGQNHVRAAGIVRADASLADLLVDIDLQEPPALSASPGLAAVERVRAEIGVGWDGSQQRAIVDLWSLDVDLGRRSLRAPTPGRVTVTADEILVETLSLRSGTATADISGTLGTLDSEIGLRVQVVGDLAEFSDLANVAVALAATDPSAIGELALRGALDSDLTIGGTREAPRPNGTVHVANGGIEVRGQPPLTDVEARLEISDGGLALTVERATWNGVEMDAVADMPWRLVPLPEAMASALPASEPGAEATVRVGLLVSTLPAAFTDGVDGLADAVINLRTRIEARTSDWSLEAIRGSAVVDQLEVRYDNLALSQTRPTQVSVEGGSARVDAWAWQISEGAYRGEVALEGSAALDGSTLDLAGAIDLPLAALTAQMPGTALGGRLHGALQVRGSLDQPDTTGDISLTGASLARADPRFVLGDINGTFRFAGTRVSADEIRGTINGGDLAVSMAFDLAPSPRPTGLASATVRSMVLETRGARVLTDADLTFSAPAGVRPRVFGEVRLLGGGYRSRRSLAAELLAFVGTGLEVQAEPSMLDEIQYDVRISNTDPLIVDTPYAEIGLETDLQLVGTYERPSILGRVNVLEGGRFRLAGNSYTVERGALDFVDPARITPLLDIQAQARIGGEDITVSLSGDAFDPDVAASAESGLDSGDVLSLMATGRTLRDAGVAGQTVLTEQAFEVLTGQYLAGTVRRLGFDSLAFERAGAGTTSASELFPRDTDFASRLTLIRTIEDVFDLVFSQNLSNTQERTWIGTLQLPYELALRAGTFDDRSRSVELQHTITMGRGTERTERAPAPRIGAVTLAGDIEPWRDDLQSRLRLERGDDFDFLRWQVDRDRLLERLHDLGHLEAAVRSTRSEPTPGVVDLAHDITPGLETVLEIQGELDDDGRRALREAWSGALVDAFLVGDLEAAARDDLLSHGYPAPDVRVRVAVEGNIKRAVIVVEPGIRRRPRPALIVGNAGISSAEILARLELADLPARGWAQPEAVSDVVRDLYQQQGWLNARVQTTGPVVSGDDARLRVEVDEGDRLILRAIRFEGNTAIDDSTLQRAVGLRPRTPWGRAVLDDVITDATNAYLRLGYNGVALRPRVTIDEATAAVDLEFAVEEGRQQILSTVEIEGLRRIRRGVVERALDAQVGEPLRLADVQRARRRLYSLGVFSRVSIRSEARGQTDEQSDAVALVVSVREQPAAVIRYGLQLFSEETLEDKRRSQTGVAATAVHPGLLGFAADASLTARYRSDQRLVRGRIGFRRFFGLPVATNLIGELGRRDEDGFFTTRISDTVVTLEQSVRPADTLTIGYALSAKRTRTRLLTDLDLPQLDPVTSVRFVPTLVYDTRDDVLAPRRGMFHSLTFEWAPSGLGSELLFRKLSTRHYAFVPIGPMTSATAIRFGSGTSLDPTSADLPRGELFLAGGPTSVRGYPSNSLGGQDFFGQLIPGGNAVLVLNQELRFPAWRWIEGVAFVDAGHAFANLSSIRVTELETSVGLGLRLVTPYLMLRLDYGVRLNDVAAFPDAARGRFHFGIGHIF